MKELTCYWYKSSTFPPFEKNCINFMIMPVCNNARRNVMIVMKIKSTKSSTYDSYENKKHQKQYLKDEALLHINKCWQASSSLKRSWWFLRNDNIATSSYSLFQIKGYETISFRFLFASSICNSKDIAICSENSANQLLSKEIFSLSSM